MEATEEVELREGPLDGGGVAAGGTHGVDVLERGTEGAAAGDTAPLRVEGGAVEATMMAFYLQNC